MKNLSEEQLTSINGGWSISGIVGVLEDWLFGDPEEDK